MNAIELPTPMKDSRTLAIEILAKTGDRYLRRLSPRQRVVVELILGIGGSETQYSIREVGAMLKTTQSRVSVIANMAFERIAFLHSFENAKSKDWR